jgi:ABC-type glycerol-3-phosphate transport system substrate-binding protein
VPRISPSRLIRFTSLATVIAAGIWLLWPPAPARGPGPATDAPVASVKHVIRFAPGAGYFPGTIPQGLGPPLQGLSRVVAAFEAQFPDTRVEIINVPVAREYLVTQLSGGAAPDIVSVNVEDVWTDVQKQWYVPLDRYLNAPNPFVAARDPQAPGARQWWDMFRYQAISRAKQAPDGGNYCVSLDMVETGIFYNKTFFAAHGLRPPDTWSEFLALMARIKRLGKTPLLTNIDSLADWGQDLLFDQLYRDLLPGIDLTRDPARDAYLQGYLDADELTFLRTKGFFTRRDPRYAEVWRHLSELRPYINRDLVTTDLTREFVTQRGIMFWNGSWFVGRLAADRQLGFDWGVFYLPPLTRENSPYATGVPMCVIGGVGTQFEVTNSALADTDPALPFAERLNRSARLQRVVALLQFICLPENTAAIVNEYAGFIPNIVGVPALPPLAPFVKILERRYTTTKWNFSFDLRFNDILRRMLQLYMTGGIGKDEFLDWQYGNIDTAMANFTRRKPADFPRLEREWQRLAPVRAALPGLPAEPSPR